MPQNNAKDFFGQDFGIVVTQVQEKATETASKAFSFFGIDFGIKKEKEMNVEPSRPSPEPSKHTFDSVFSNLIQAESGGKHLDEKGKLVRSPVGAEGISQLMPTTAKKPGYGIEPVKDKSEGEYIRVGKEYLSKLYEKFGDWEKALAAYNAGVGNVMKAEGKAERFGGDWKDHLPKKEETIPYIKKILGKDVRAIYGGDTPEKTAKLQEGKKIIAEMAPVSGEILSAVDAKEQFEQGNYGSAALAAVGALPLVGTVGKGGKSFIRVAEHFFKTPFDVKNGYISVLNNPIHLKDGSRLSGFTDAKQTTFHGYDKNGERFSIKADHIKPEDVVGSKDSNKTADYIKKQLIGEG